MISWVGPTISRPPSSFHLFSYGDIGTIVRVVTTNRAVDEDGFQAKFLKHGFWSLNSHIIDLYYHVVCFGFPHAWTKHVIHPIFKLGASSNLKTYCTIMVGTLSQSYIYSFASMAFR
jgi:hypothetical protein